MLTPRQSGVYSFSKRSRCRAEWAKLRGSQSWIANLPRPLVNTTHPIHVPSSLSLSQSKVYIHWLTTYALTTPYAWSWIFFNTIGYNGTSVLTVIKHQIYPLQTVGSSPIRNLLQDHPRGRSRLCAFVRAWGLRNWLHASLPFPPSLLPPSPAIVGRRLNGFLGLSLNEWTILFLVISLDKTKLATVPWFSVFSVFRSFQCQDWVSVQSFSVPLSIRYWQI